MTNPSQRFLFEINQTALAQVLTQLPNKQPLSLQMTEDTAQFALASENEFAAKLVLFGQPNWLQLQQVLTDLPTELVNVVVNKPTAELAEAVQFNLASELTQAQQQKLVKWAETQELELCYLTSKINLNQPGLIVMDMDSTAIEIECIDEIAKLAGVGEQVAEVTAQAMRGELDFAESLRARVATLKDAPISVIDQVANNLPLMPGLENLVRVLQQHNWKVVIASGGFTYMTEKLKQLLDLDKTVANQLGMADGKLTGEVHGAIVDAQTKADTVVELAQQWNIPMSQTIAMGDGANDLVMMSAAELGVAFHAKPLVREKADVSVRTGGLDQLLYLI